MPLLKKLGLNPGAGLKWQEMYGRFQFSPKIREHLDIS